MLSGFGLGRSGWRRGVGSALFFLGVVCPAGILGAASVSLSWSPSDGTNVAGYRLEYGTFPGIHPVALDARAATSIAVPGLADATTYYFVVTAYDAAGGMSAPSNEVNFTTPSDPTAAPSRLTNLSTRSYVSGSVGPTINGFIVSGTGLKTVILRALGPTLASFGISETMADPTLAVYDKAGNLVAANDNWADTQAPFFGPGGAGHDLQPNSALESALVVQLPAGNYTAVAQGNNGNAGIVLTDLYDFGGDSGVTLFNISARAYVDGADRVLIGGIIVGGSNSAPMIMRALGPSLAKFGIGNALADPALDLYDANGTLLGTNDDWISDSAQMAVMVAAGYALSDSHEAAIAVTLAHGNYTVIVRGSNLTAGTALFDAYRLP